MKKLTPEHGQASEFEGRLSDIISGVTMLTREVEPIQPDVATLYYLYNFPIATTETLSWIIKASLEDDDVKSNRIGISTYRESKIVCGKTFTSITQQLSLHAKNVSTDTMFKHNTTFDYGIQINPKTRKVVQVSDDNTNYFDFKANPLTNRFGFNANMTDVEMLGSFGRVVNAALRKELILKAEF